MRRGASPAIGEVSSSPSRTAQLIASRSLRKCEFAVSGERKRPSAAATRFALSSSTGVSSPSASPKNLAAPRSAPRLRRCSGA